MSLGDRIKGYEYVTRHYLTKRTPLLIRVDGRAFHTFTKGLERPFDSSLMDAMVLAACDTANGMQGFKAGYVQSDEATFLLTDYDSVETQGWFDYNLSKIISISAATMSVSFNKRFETNKQPVFDSRAFSVPYNDVVNAFLWRAQDWERNSLQMYARSVFSHKELHGKNRADIHEMLYQKGLNWTTDLTPQQRNGTFLLTDVSGVYIQCDVLPTFNSINEIIGGFVKPE